MTHEDPAVNPSKKRSRFLLFWAIGATVAAFLFANIALVLAVRLRAASEPALAPAPEAPPPEIAQRPPPRAPRAQVVETFPEEPAPTYPTRGSALTRPINASFTNLVDSDVAGRYRFSEESGEVGVITLMPDHTTVNKEGITIRQYRWEIQPDGIMTHWRRFNILFNDIEKPGVYVARRENGLEYSRLERVQP